ncbi:MAG: hypothetical protein WD076_06760, partial [Parvularculaceae bacterium]
MAGGESRSPLHGIATLLAVAITLAGFLGLLALGLGAFGVFDASVIESSSPVILRIASILFSLGLVLLVFLVGLPAKGPLASIALVVIGIVISAPYFGAFDAPGADWLKPKPKKFDYATTPVIDLTDGTFTTTFELAEGAQHYFRISIKQGTLLTFRIVDEDRILTPPSYELFAFTPPTDGDDETALASSARLDRGIYYFSEVIAAGNYVLRIKIAPTVLDDGPPAPRGEPASKATFRITAEDAGPRPGSVTNLGPEPKTVSGISVGREFGREWYNLDASRALQAGRCLSIEARVGPIADAADPTIELFTFEGDGLGRRLDDNDD